MHPAQALPVASAPSQPKKAGESTLPQQVEPALQRAIAHLAARQAADGHWPGDYSGPLFLLPGLLIAYHITGTPLADYRRQRMRQHLLGAQNADGGWGLHVEGESTVFGTALNYVALRILGVAADDPAAQRARRRLHALGGAEAIPTWGKFWLAVLNVYQWQGVPPLSPELWLLPRLLPVHPGNFWCHTRAVFLPMSDLYGQRRQGPETPLVLALRDELFTQPWANIQWPSLAFRVAEADLYTPPSPVLRSMQRGMQAFEWLHEHAPQRGLTRRALTRLRQRALATTAAHIRHEDETTAYLTIGPVSKAIHWLAAWFADPQSEAVRQHVARIDDYLWDGVDGMKMQGYNGSQLWDTAFACLALLEVPLPAIGTPEAQRPPLTAALLPTLRRGYAYVDAQQVRDDIPCGEGHHRDRIRGTWPFSTREQAWTVSDCTGHGLEVAVRGADWVEHPIGIDRLLDAADALLASQNADGGWSEYEHARAPAWVEKLNAAEVFGDIMIAHSYPECTSSVLQGLAALQTRHAGYRAADVRRAMARGAQYLRQSQRSDGSWYGGWGVCFTYGTWFGIEGLRACGFAEDRPRIAQAAQFLWSKQREDGSWGESYRSCVEQRWVEHERPQAVQTAWALLGLMAAQPRVHRPAIERGIGSLLRLQSHDGGWPHSGITGVFNRNCMIHYDNYPAIMPLWALARYTRLFA